MPTESAFKNQSREEWGETTGTHLGYLEAYMPKSVAVVYPWALSEAQSWEQIASTDGRAVTSFLLFLLAITLLCFQSVN